jgi:hypothetical protein
LPSVVVFEQAGTILAMAVEVGDRDVFHQIGQPFPVAADLQTTVERVPVEQKDIPLVHAQWLEPSGPVHLVEVIERAAIRCHSTRRGGAFSHPGDWLLQTMTAGDSPETAVGFIDGPEWYPRGDDPERPEEIAVPVNVSRAADARRLPVQLVVE